MRISNALLFHGFSNMHINVNPIFFLSSVQLLRQRKPNAPQEWLEKLPAMAKRLEESLYRSAPSFDAYNDINTLKQRLQQLEQTVKIYYTFVDLFPNSRYVGDAEKIFNNTNTQIKKLKSNG